MKEPNNKLPVLSVEKVAVDALINDLDDMLFAIKKADELILSLEPGQPKDHYKTELDKLLKDYNELCLQLKVMLYNYFIYERKHKLAVNFNYRKLYKRIK